jgi:hypothetical protein
MSPAPQAMSATAAGDLRQGAIPGRKARTLSWLDEVAAATSFLTPRTCGLKPSAKALIRPALTKPGIRVAVLSPVSLPPGGRGVTSRIAPSELDVYLSLVTLLHSLPEPSLQVDCRTRSSDGVDEYLIYTSRAARAILSSRLERDLHRVLDLGRDEWVLSVDEAKAIAGHRLW